MKKKKQNLGKNKMAPSYLCTVILMQRNYRSKHLLEQSKLEKCINRKT